jgi:formylmethanofuran dehydrogenase subunit B
MNIEIRDNSNDILEKICKEMKMNPSQLMGYLLDIVQNLYSDYEHQKDAEIEKESFKAILTNLFLRSFKSKLRTLNVAEKLIESTNELLGIKEYVGAIIHNINPDFDNRSISYSIGYEFCLDAANMLYTRPL